MSMQYSNDHWNHDDACAPENYPRQRGPDLGKAARICAAVVLPPLIVWALFPTLWVLIIALTTVAIYVAAFGTVVSAAGALVVGWLALVNKARNG